jgi:NAD(P)-dependent dehydrogenase (short-subunit alcohol dehydrogenase family)
MRTAVDEADPMDIDQEIVVPLAHEDQTAERDAIDVERPMGINFWSVRRSRGVEKWERQMLMLSFFLFIFSRGVVYGTKAFLPTMINAGKGTIVNISSVFGLFAVPSQG